MAGGEARPAVENVVALFEEKAAAPLPPTPPVKEALAVGLAALRWFYDRLTPTVVEMRGVLPNGEKVPDPLPSALLKKVAYVPVPMLEKRGLTPETCAALGYRANPRSNEDLLRAMRDEFDWDELVASGLWLEADRRWKQDRRPNTQFCGNGQTGRKPEEERKDADDKWQWGWCQPVLIPYFDDAGQLLKLRPHKGGAAVGTAAGGEWVYAQEPGVRLQFQAARNFPRW